MDVNVQDKDGYTLLNRAVSYNNYDIAEFLLEKGASPNISSRDDTTPLHKIASDAFNKNAKSIYITKLLLQKGGLIESKDTFGCTPIHWAVRLKNFEMAKVFIEYGADLNVIVQKNFYKGKSLIEIASLDNDAYR